MFLFIFESIGTSELILIGIIALVFLGPRKLPELARKAGKIMSEFRGTANEFKETWQREVNFEEEAKLLNIKDLDQEPLNDPPAGREPVQTETVAAPTIKEVDPSQMRDLIDIEKNIETTSSDSPGPDDKQNWL